MSLSVLDESQFFLCLMIADSKSWQQNLRGERKKKIKSPEFYLTEVKKHFFFYKWLFLHMDGVNWRLFCIFL